jgi:riboflavin transporter FmnP
MAELDLYSKLLETSKLTIDFAKHITTLASGSIVVISAFLTKEPSSHIKARYLLGISVGFLLVSLLMSILTIKLVLDFTETIMFADFDSDIEVAKKQCGSAYVEAKRQQAASHLCFVFGLVCLGIFVWNNL